MKRFLLIAVSLILFFNLTGCSGGLSAEFKDDYALFVESADRMVGLTVDDISYPEFLTQLEVVQNYYINLDAHKWPDQLSTAHASFESAMRSLNLVKDVWDVYNKGSGSWRCSLDRDVGNAVALTLEISERLDDTDESTLKWLRSQTCDMIINDLMKNFSLHYKVGKNKIIKFIEIPD
ncbi:MAG: hypothetical protein Q7U53_13505 [Anaerolineaceae bacterium]|nr:hypothetical protein [Anaerolineaceae bacterium]